MVETNNGTSDKTKRMLHFVFIKRGKPLSVKELATATGVSKRNASDFLAGNTGLAKRISRGKYEVVKDPLPVVGPGPEQLLLPDDGLPENLRPTGVSQFPPLNPQNESGQDSDDFLIENE